MSTLYLCGAGNSEGVRLAQTVNEQEGRWDRIVILDDDPNKQGQSILGVEIAGPFTLLEEADSDTAEVVNLVARTTFKRWTAQQKIAEYGLPFASLVSPSVDTRGVHLAEDVIVYHNAVLCAEASVGQACVVFMGAIVGHGCRMGRCSVAAANSVISARVDVGDEVYVGTNATILPDVVVGECATVGAGSVVVGHVPAGATVMGVPARTVLTMDHKLKMGGAASLNRASSSDVRSLAQ